MKTNYLLSLLIVFSFIALTSFSISTNSISKSKKIESVIEKDTFNIMASHGIYLRDSANLTSKKLAELPYATKIVFLNQDTISTEITIQETKYFEIKGRMQKVKVISLIDSLNNLEGYVFDGYLTKFPLPKLNYQSKEDNYVPADLYYFESNFGVSEKIIKKCPIDSMDIVFGNKIQEPCQHTLEQKFGDVIMYKSICEESGGSNSFTFKGLMLREAYFIFYILYFEEARNETDENGYNYGYEGDIIIYEKDKKQIRIEPKGGGAGCYYEIKQKENAVFVSSYCGC